MLNRKQEYLIVYCTKIGNNNIPIKNFNKDKLRITVILCILSDGTIIPPLIIFRGKTNKNKEKKL